MSLICLICCFGIIFALERDYFIMTHILHS